MVVLLISAPTLATEFPLSCTYVANTRNAELEPHSGCAARRDGGLVFAPAQLRSMKFSNHSLAEVAVDDGWYYVNRAGRSLRVLTYDNGADYFQEGLVRSPVNGRIAFYDASLRQVLPPKYDWAWPFSEGRALVCSGCVPGPPEDSDGHSGLIGGSWGYIDHKGREVVSLTPRNSAPPAPHKD